MRRFGGHEDVEPVRARLQRVLDERGDLLHQGLVHRSDLRERDGAVRGHGPALLSNGGTQRAAFLKPLRAPVASSGSRQSSQSARAPPPRAGHLDAAAVARERPPEGRAQRREAVRVRRELRRALEARAALRRRGDEEREAPRRLYETRRREPRGLGRLRRAEGRGPGASSASKVVGGPPPPLTQVPAKPTVPARAAASELKMRQCSDAPFLCRCFLLERRTGRRELCRQ